MTSRRDITENNDKCIGTHPQMAASLSWFQIRELCHNPKTVFYGQYRQPSMIVHELLCPFVLV